MVPTMKQSIINKDEFLISTILKYFKIICITSKVFCNENARIFCDNIIHFFENSKFE
jgi:hypothetical protein